MKQCPSCNRTYTNDKQKFCTLDGTSLVDPNAASVPMGETVRIDSTQLESEVTKVISQDLPRVSDGGFDPYKTVVSTPAQTPPATTPGQATSPPAAPPVDPYKTVVSMPTPPATTPGQVTTPPAPTTSAPPPVPPSAATTALPAPPAPVATPPAAPPPQPPSTEAPPAAAAEGGESGQVTLPPPVAAPAPPVAAPAAAAAAVAPPVAPRKKRSKLPLILGILFVLFLLVAGIAVAGYFLYPKLKPMLAKRGITVPEPRRIVTRPEPSPNVVSTPEVENPNPETPKVEVPPYSPPANAVQFVNSSGNLTGKLAEHYVDFSFYYPKNWQKDPKAGVAGATNFVQVERSLPPNYTLENFAVGWYGSAGSAELDRTAFPRLVESLSAKFEKSIDKYRKISEHETKVGPYNAYEFRFEGSSQPTDKGQFKIWGVGVFIPPVDGGKDGVTLLMLATSLAPELKTINDVGVKGDLPMMLESFRFGK
jgi:hypothetical protein